MFLAAILICLNWHRQSLAEIIPGEGYFNRLVHTTRLTLLEEMDVVNFAHCTTKCQLYNSSDTCSGIAFDQDTKRCSLKFVDFTVMPTGPREELFVKSNYFGEEWRAVSRA